MKLLLDQNVFVEIAELLRVERYDVLHTREIGLARASDVEIMRFAFEHGRVIVTHDEDYHMLLAAQAATAPSVVRLRVMLPPLELAQLITATLHTFRDALLAGAAVSVTSRGARMHRLPLG